MELSTLTTVTQIKKYVCTTRDVKPQAVLDRLFAIPDWDNSTGKARVGIHYAAHKSGNGVTSFTFVSQALLSMHHYSVGLGHDGSVHVTLHDYVDCFWPDRGGSLNLVNKKEHDATVQRMTSHVDYPGAAFLAVA